MQKIQKVFNIVNINIIEQLHHLLSMTEREYLLEK